MRRSETRTGRPTACRAWAILTLPAHTRQRPSRNSSGRWTTTEKSGPHSAKRTASCVSATRRSAGRIGPRPSSPLSKLCRCMNGAKWCSGSPTACSLAEVAVRNGSAEYARRFFGPAASMYLRTGDVLGEANCIMRLAEVARLSSNFEDARNAYRQALTMFQKIGDAAREGVCVRQQADKLPLNTGDKARSLWAAAISLKPCLYDVAWTLVCQPTLPAEHAVA